MMRFLVIVNFSHFSAQELFFLQYTQNKQNIDGLKLVTDLVDQTVVYNRLLASLF
jgi:hypothetical protein